MKRLLTVALLVASVVVAPVVVAPVVVAPVVVIADSHITAHVYQKVQDVAANIGLIRTVTGRRIATGDRPADVCDAATTVLSELAHITSEMDAPGVAMPPIPRPKHVPSHVYQIASMLQEQLANIERGDS